MTKYKRKDGGLIEKEVEFKENLMQDHRDFKSFHEFHKKNYPHNKELHEVQKRIVSYIEEIAEFYNIELKR